jgi:hypothetical protein
MLAGVLLHVIEAASPVDFSRYFTGSDRSIQHMDDAAILIDNVDYRGPSENSGIEGLAARGWIKRRAIEIDAPPIAGRINDDRAKFPEIRIVVIKPFGHRAYFTLRAMRKDRTYS